MQGKITKFVVHGCFLHTILWFTFNICWLDTARKHEIQEHLQLKVSKIYFHVHGCSLHTSLWFTLSAALATATEHEISGAPPPKTILLSLTKLRITHNASCILLFPSSTIWKNNYTLLFSFIHSKAFPSLLFKHF